MMAMMMTTRFKDDLCKLCNEMCDNHFHNQITGGPGKTCQATSREESFHWSEKASWTHWYGESIKSKWRAKLKAKWIITWKCRWNSRWNLNDGSQVKIRIKKMNANLNENIDKNLNGNINGYCRWNKWSLGLVWTSWCANWRTSSSLILLRNFLFL